MAIVGSMEVIGLFKDMGLFMALKKMQAQMKQSAHAAKEVSIEMVRGAKNASLLSKAMGLLGLGGFAALLTSMPRVNAELTQTKTWVELIGLEMDDNLAPATHAVNVALEGLYNWFTGLTETQQSIVVWAGIVTLALVSIGVAAGRLSLALKGLGLSGFITWLGNAAGGIAAFVAGSLAAQVAIGLLTGALGVLALDKIGVLDWVSGIGERFRTAYENGETWAEIIMLLVGNFALLGDAILALLGIKEWSAFHADLEKMDRILSSILGKVKDLLGSAWGNMTNAFSSGLGMLGFSTEVDTSSLGGYEVHDTGGMAGYTGFHWLKAGETINNTQVSSFNQNSQAPSATGGDTYITIENNFSGDNVLNNGMDFDDFVEKTSAIQAEKLAWRGSR